LRNFVPAIAAAAVCAAAVLLSACSEQTDTSPVTLTLSGDSLSQMTEQELPGGYSTFECPVEFRADVEGPEGAFVNIRGGRIRYWWWMTGVEASTYDLTPEAVLSLWQDSLIYVGAGRTSRKQGFGQSAPSVPVRGEATFDYVTSNTGEQKQTEPYRFYCY
jgi:hypothetical protein